jgi:hypothetical protein
VVAIDKKIEVKRTRSSGEKSIVVLDPSYPTEGLRIYNSTESKIFDFDVHNGRLALWGTDGNYVNKQTGTIKTGINGGGALISLNDETGTNTIRINGGDGTVWAANADLAENFACSQEYNSSPDEGYGTITDPIEPGDVLVISEDGTLVKCEEKYDTRVAGVVSGAKDFKPAIILDSFEITGSKENSPGVGVFPVALAGKVFCRVCGEVRTGDLLVTSSKKGHAMRADPKARERWSGAILGKALGSAKSGSNLIPVLVMLG